MVTMAGVGAFGARALRSKHDSPKVEGATSEVQTTRTIVLDQVTFSISEKFRQIDLSEKDISDKFIGKFELNAGNDKSLITVKKEDNLNLVSAISGKNAMDAMLTNASKVLPAQYPDYNEIRQQQFSWAGVNAAEIFFTYTALNTEKAKNHVLILLKNQDEAVVFTFQALEKDFDQIDSDYFKPIRESIRFE